MKTELIALKLAEWANGPSLALIERRATVRELIEAAVAYVGDDLIRIAVALAEQKTGLTFGKNKRAGDDRVHMEWHAKCGCAYHPEPFPHVHPCSDAHKRPDLHSGSREADIRQLHEKFDKLAAKDPMNNEASSKWRAFASELIAILERPAGSRERCRAWIPGDGPAPGPKAPPRRCTMDAGHEGLHFDGCNYFTPRAFDAPVQFREAAPDDAGLVERLRRAAATSEQSCSDDMPDCTELLREAASRLAALTGKEVGRG